jgi:hypothetical protein
MPPPFIRRGLPSTDDESGFIMIPSLKPHRKEISGKAYTHVRHRRYNPYLRYEIPPPGR